VHATFGCELLADALARRLVGHVEWLDKRAPATMRSSLASASSLSIRRADSTTSAPASESTSAVARPIPLLAPVIQARFP
jgi:hypothetical protein